MKAIIYCSKDAGQWVREFFPGLFHYEIRFANKLISEFLVDFCVLNGIKEVKMIFDEMPSSKLLPHFGNGEQYGISLSCDIVKIGTTVNTLLNDYQNFSRGDDLLLLQGFLWLNYNKEQKTDFSVGADQISGKKFDDSSAYYLIGKNRLNDAAIDQFEEDQQLDALPVDSIKKYFELNMLLLGEKYTDYSLPGYGSRIERISIGLDVSIPASVKISAPVICGDHVVMENNVTVESNVIIGNHVIIDEDTTLSSSIVMGNSYVGRNSEINNKIIYNCHVIDPLRGISINVVDDFLLSGIRKSPEINCSIWHRISAAVMLVIYFAPFCLLRFFIKIHADAVMCFVERQQRKNLKLKLYLAPSTSFFCRYFRKLSLDRYHLLPQVLCGHLRLVGSRLLEVNEYNAERLKQFPDYAPGLFSYSEFLNQTEDGQWEVSELSYIYHASFWLNSKIIVGVLLRNLLKRT